MNVEKLRVQIEALQGNSDKTDLFINVLAGLESNALTDKMVDHNYQLELQRVSDLMKELSGFFRGQHHDYDGKVKEVFEMLERFDSSESDSGRVPLSQIALSLEAKAKYFDGHVKRVKPFSGRRPNLNREDFIDWVLKAFCACYGRWPKQTEYGNDMETIVAILQDAEIHIEDYKKLIGSRTRILNKKIFNWPVVFHWVQ